MAIFNSYVKLPEGKLEQIPSRKEPTSDRYALVPCPEALPSKMIALHPNENGRILKPGKSRRFKP